MVSYPSLRSQREPQNEVLVSSVYDFPAPSSGVITLANNTAYKLDGNVNIGDNRIVSGENSVLYGVSPEVAYLGNSLDGEALLTSQYNTPLWRLSLYTSGAGASILDFDGDQNKALDWQFINFSGGNVGTIANYGNIICHTIGYIDKTSDGFPALGSGFVFDGTIGTISFTDSIFVVSGSGNVGISVPSSATISRRLRITECAVVASSGATGISVDGSATIQSEGYILRNVNFSGGATYLSGVTYIDDKARFEGCRGIKNSYSLSNYTMVGNATTTTIGATGTPVKVAGTTTNNSATSKFDNIASNKSIYTGALTQEFKVSVTMSVTSGNNNQVGFYVAKNGTVINESETYITANSSGRLENASIQAVVELSTNDYIEIFVENNTTTTNVTVEDLNVTVSRVP